MCMAKISCPPQSGRVGDVVYVASSRFGQIVRKFVPPRNPRTPAQQRTRSNWSAVVSSWRGLEPAQRLAWCLAATDNRLRLNGYNYYIQVNARRAHLDLSLFPVPPDPAPSVGPNPVAELAVTNNGGRVSLKVRVPSTPAQYTLVQGAAPVSAGVRCVTHFPYLGLLPAPVNGWSDITELYVARYGAPLVGSVVFIRTCQQVDGWADTPKVTSALVPAG